MYALEIILSALVVIFLLAGTVVFLRFRKASLKLKEISVLKNNYENIALQANDAMLVIDIADGKIHTANPKLSELLGYSADDIMKLSVFDIHPKDMITRSSEIIADVWEKKGLIYKDLPFVTSSGDVLPVECSAKVVPYNNKPAILIYARDIRERLRMEKEIRDRNKIIEDKNKDITDSINYAKRIQNAILPSEKLWREKFTESFILYLPKDIVAGDFYWMTEINLPAEATSSFVRQTGEKRPRYLSGDTKNTKDDRCLPTTADNCQVIYVAAADSTGHGVPGAIVSVVCANALNHAIKEIGPCETGKLLDRTREIVIEQLSNNNEDVKDGMDISLLRIDHLTGTEGLVSLQWSGANNPLWYFQNGEFKELKGDRQPIGAGYAGLPFTTHTIQIQTGQPQTFYLFTDGYADQFGEPSEKKFKYKQLKDKISEIYNKPMEEQKKILHNTIEKWRGSLDQTDDILVIGIRI